MLSLVMYFDCYYDEVMGSRAMIKLGGGQLVVGAQSTLQKFWHSLPMTSLQQTVTHTIGKDVMSRPKSIKDG